MTSYEIRGSLARCLATENLTVEHRSVSTAMFDVDRRVLTLPNWKKASDTVYQMLLLHECGHALFTDNINWKEDYPDTPRDFVNVIEDVRVERLMKKKYPGSSRTFYNGYQELNDEDFFSIEDENLNDLPLIDRINLYFKIGAFTNIQFNDDENEFLTQASTAETFEDVLKLSKLICDYVKTSSKEDPDINIEPLNSIGNQEEEDDDNDDEKEINPSHADGDQDTTQEVEDSEKSTENDDNSSGVEEEEDDDELKSKTSQAFEENSKKLNGDHDGSIKYVELPMFDYNRLIIPNNHVHDLCDLYYKRYINDDQQIECDKSYREFKKNSEREVSYLVKEFECKKTADQYARSTTARTGVLNTSKLHTYKYNEDLFRKVSIVPDGKNHGLIFIFDWSGSMQDYLLDTYKQLCSLVWFCKKVSIPFEVYSFQSEVSAYAQYDPSPEPIYTKKKSTIAPDVGFRLVNILTSKVNSRVLDHQMNTLFRICDSYQSRRYRIPDHMCLSGTPLGEALISMNQVIPHFISENGVQKTNVIFMTDGEGYACPYHVEKVDYKGEDYLGMSNRGIVSIRNRKNGHHYTPIKNYRGNFSKVAKTLLHYLKDEFPNVNFVNFRITNTKELSNCWSWYGDENDDYGKIKNDFRKQKYVSFTTSGFDKFFVLQSTSLNSESDFTVTDNATKRQIKNAFVKSLERKKTNKKVLNEFVCLVS